MSPGMLHGPRRDAATLALVLLGCATAPPVIAARSIPSAEPIPPSETCAVDDDCVSGPPDDCCAIVCDDLRAWNADALAAFVASCASQTCQPATSDGPSCLSTTAPPILPVCRNGRCILGPGFAVHGPADP